MIEIITTIFSFLSATVVAYLGYLSAKKTKEDKAYRELQDQLAEEKQKAEMSEKEQRAIEMDEMSQKIDTMTKSFSDIKEQISDLDDNVSRLSNLTKFNLEYSAEINNALVILGSSMSSENPDREQISKQLLEHQQKTNEIQKNLYKTDF